MQLGAGRDQVAASLEALQELQEKKCVENEPAMDRVRRPAGEQVMPAGFSLEAANVLSAQSGIGSLRQGVRELKAPAYGAKVGCDTMLIKWEADCSLGRRSESGWRRDRRCCREVEENGREAWEADEAAYDEVEEEEEEDKCWDGVDPHGIIRNVRKNSERPDW